MWWAVNKVSCVVVCWAVGPLMGAAVVLCGLFFWGVGEGGGRLLQQYVEECIVLCYVQQRLLEGSAVVLICCSHLYLTTPSPADQRWYCTSILCCVQGCWWGPLLFWSVPTPPPPVEQNHGGKSQIWTKKLPLFWKYIFLSFYNNICTVFRDAYAQRLVGVHKRLHQADQNNIETVQFIPGVPGHSIR